ncbi:uncharacterized protein [Littorina saxatilis]|uniref:DUF3504 domain-containing protein n=1 Tax=Littorina saxatilis TaxID=31220 RepID=A0AAN9AMA3_9CAEN
MESEGNFELSLSSLSDSEWENDEDIKQFIAEEGRKQNEHATLHEADKGASAQVPVGHAETEHQNENENNEGSIAVDAGFDEPPKNSTKKRKRQFLPTTEQERKEIADNVDSKGTKRATKFGVKLFKEWLEKEKLDPAFEELSPNDLNEYLRRFYPEMRSGTEKRYSKSTMAGVRASINRHLTNPPFLRNICIMKDSAFSTSNKMFCGVLKKAKEEGCDETKHYPNIAESDLTKLRSDQAFDLNDPTQLQEKVWFDLQLHFARRGMENTRSLKASSFAIKTDDMGKEYAYLKHAECTNNHPGKMSDTNYKTKKRMYANGTATCPLKSFRLLLEKRNKENDVLYQKPRTGRKFNPTQDVWYLKSVRGHNTLAVMMPRISQRLGLSERYTNHSVRATTVSVLADNGVEAREIMRITDHKNEGSLRSYNTDSTDSRKRAYSSFLQNANVEQSEAGCGISPPTPKHPQNKAGLTACASSSCVHVSPSSVSNFTNIGIPMMNITNSVVNVHYHST